MIHTLFVLDFAAVGSIFILIQFPEHSAEWTQGRGTYALNNTYLERQPVSPTLIPGYHLCPESDSNQHSND